MQGIINAVRAVADVPRMYQYLRTRSIVLRRTAGQVALAEWLVRMLDRPRVASQRSAIHGFRRASSGHTAARISYLPEATSLETLQDATNSLRRSVKRAEDLSSVSAAGHCAAWNPGGRING
jgi:hypothetical protein